MLIPYTAPAGPVRTELIIRKSTFIADLAPVSSLEEAADFRLARKKEFRGATHWCYACRIGTERIEERSSDDGEPQGTAGHPILYVLQRQDLTNTVLVVTRWFGGIKLGAPGLTRAYSDAAAQVCQAASLIAHTPHLSVQLVLAYGDLGLLETYLAGTDLIVTDRTFSDRVTVALYAPPADWARREADLTNLTAGRIHTEVLGEAYVPLTAERK